MELRGQHGDRGYAMAALLIGLAVMSVLMTAVLPAWRHQAKREKEAELVFRGEQYVRAIRLWEMKMGPGTRPPTFDVLVQQRFLRKKYKDPMTEDGEFQPLFVGTNLGPGGGLPGGRVGRGGAPQPQPQTPPTSIGQQMGGGGIIGVVSKSKESSIRIYQGGSHYNEWRFVFANMSNTPGGRGGSPMPGGRGGRGMPGVNQPGAPRGGPFGPGGGPFGPGQGGRGPRQGGPGMPPGGPRGGGVNR